MFKIDIEGLEVFDNLQNVLEKETGKIFNDIVDDLVIVSSGLTPYDTGVLTKSTLVEKQLSGTTPSADISFNTKYADYMHNGTYNLGDGSLSRRPPNSMYSGKKFNVGTGYLINTGTSLQKDYEKHLGETLAYELSKKVK